MTDLELRRQRADAADFAFTYLKEAVAEVGYEYETLEQRTDAMRRTTADERHPVEGGEIRMILKASHVLLRDLTVSYGRSTAKWPSVDISNLHHSWSDAPDGIISGGCGYLLDMIGVDLELIRQRLFSALKYNGILPILTDSPVLVQKAIKSHWYRECDMFKSLHRDDESGLKALKIIEGL